MGSNHINQALTPYPLISPRIDYYSLIALRMLKNALMLSVKLRCYIFIIGFNKLSV